MSTPRGPRTSRQPNRGGIRKPGGRPPLRRDSDGDIILTGSDGDRQAKDQSNGHGRGNGRGNGRGKGRSNGRGRGRGDRGDRGRGERGSPAQVSTDGTPIELSVRGWTESKAASNQDGGLSSLHAFLERRASLSGPAAKIESGRLQGDVLIISIQPQFRQRFLHLNGFEFAKAKLIIEEIPVSSEPVSTRAPHPEIPAESDFALPTPSKPQDQLAQERLALELSFKTKMNMSTAIECLAANGWDMQRAYQNFQELFAAGSIPATAMLNV